jgi:hypothetical protein
VDCNSAIVGSIPTRASIHPAANLSYWFALGNIASPDPLVMPLAAKKYLRSNALATRV